MDASAYFKDKKITVLGLGLLGRGLGDVRYMASCGADLIVTDLKTVDALESSVAELKQFSNIRFVLGEHRLEDFRDRDFILKAAGVPLDSPYISEAQNAGIPIKMSASLFAEIAQIQIIGITGTRGKSTVTHMLHAILLAAGKKVLLGGNVRGVSTLALLPEVTSEHVALFELDSWQLQGFAESHFSPQLAVFTTFFPDHLNYYHNDLDRYLADKAAIFEYQKPEDTLVLGAQCSGLVQNKYGSNIPGKFVIYGAHDLPTEWKLMIPGEHNRYDAALALAAARAQKISDDITRAALERFKGVPGRLEFLRTVDDIEIYNDNNATTPDATLAALQALGETHKGRIVLIMGGADKGIDMKPLITAIPEFTKHLTLLAGTGTERIRNEMPGISQFSTLTDAVANAKEHAEAGDVILFSPAFASFGVFTNEYERNDQFVDIIKSL